MDAKDELSGPVNLGNPCEFTIEQLAGKILDLTGSDSPLIYKSLPTDDPKQRQPDIALAGEKMGWAPKIPLDEGLKRTITYFDAFLGDQLSILNQQGLAPNL